MPLPKATYRLQFRNGMDFEKAVGLIPHLVGLGVSHLYASPIFCAVGSSTHGYDIVDFNEIDPALGGIDGLRRLVGELKAHGLGIILDIVPNHMAAHLENRWWHSVVEWGRSSEFASHFDIDWRQPLTLPFLGQEFEEELADGRMQLAFDHDRNCLAFAYYDALYPLNPASYPAALEGCGPVLDRLIATASRAEASHAAAFHSEVASFIKAPSVAARLGAHLQRASADKTLLQRLHEMQSWRLMSWKTARDHLSYRRFFEIAGLVGLRVEDPAVFGATHRRVIDLVEEGLIDGLRVDHIDGLADPEAYLHRLRERAGEHTYIIVEKILEANEALSEGWPVDGTTGYEFISTLADLLSDESSELWSDVQQFATERAVTACKLQVLSHNFNAEVQRLAALAARVRGDDDVPAARERIAEAIRQLIAAMPVYRTYLSDRGARERDQRMLDGIEFRARAAAPEIGAEIAARVACLKSNDAEADRQAATEFRTRFQQLSGAVMAKAVEDTFFYRRGDYLAANEVGAAPSWTPGGVARFHERMRERGRSSPTGLSTTSTHDTKRGEDARARLYVIGEAPELWAAAVDRWRDMNRTHRQSGADASEASVEQFLYQSLLGAWPIEPLADENDLSSLRERMEAFAVKALREAKLRTNWDSPDERYEAAVTGFLRDILDWRNRAFLDDFENTAAPFIRAGLINSLSQTLVKLTAPGIPDIYQGSERLDLSLVDPDNRRGFSPRLSLSDLPRQPTIGDFEDCKQWLIGLCLNYRQGRGAALLASGEYLPLDIQGPASRRAAAFMRRREDQLSITLVPRLVFRHLGDGLTVRSDLWRDTYLLWPEDCEPRRLRNLVTGGTMNAQRRIPMSEVFRDFPVAFLVPQ
ncbi:malto-oligosyltrehalose synthase [Sinorhizobium americanum]|uniref:(1->4)-alpha-D-glucan 1-alpha-D-glucosylmutase n=1 Tax=Sinorhizobium americanum TaxID=194963 RepID=A0A4R2BYW4_9HYPH|nr:malto-oligosyltrehalose synthase [Sinorhizobium americanum]TCN33121.1 (1->4)-alpha-D-glucan 1-alpha-D-glucosylmutase [Sinorhizobium americanum]